MSSPVFPPEFHPLKQETNQAVLKHSQACGMKVALVGGYVRDALLKRFDQDHLPCDFDYTVMGGSAVELGKRTADALLGNFVMLDEQLDTCRVVLASGVQVDYAGCLAGDLEDDLRRRDLTVNALAWDPERPDQIIDVTGGLSDLNEKRIKAVSEKGLIEDPLRLLRVYRFAASLKFAIDPETATLVARHAQLLSKVAAERVSYELFLILDSQSSSTCIKAMADVGLLEIIFPELSACREVTANAFHHLGLFDHSIEAFVQCERAFAQLPPWTEEYFAHDLAHNVSKAAATKLAALLHDIGKPATWQIRPDGKHTFIGHDKLGAEMIEDTSRRLKWARPVERFVASLVRWHLRPGALFHQGPPTQRAIYRFYREVEPDLPQLILLAQGDFRATCGPGLLERRDVLENQIRELLENYAVYVESKKAAPRLLDGRDVMNLLKIEPGPVIGELLSDLEEARSLGEVMNEQQARDFVLERYKQKYCK